MGLESEGTLALTRNNTVDGGGMLGELYLLFFLTEVP